MQVVDQHAQTVGGTGQAMRMAAILELSLAV